MTEWKLGKYGAKSYWAGPLISISSVSTEWHRLDKQENIFAKLEVISDEFSEPGMCTGENVCVMRQLSLTGGQMRAGGRRQNTQCPDENCGGGPLWLYAPTDWRCYLDPMATVGQGSIPTAEDAYAAESGWRLLMSTSHSRHLYGSSDPITLFTAFKTRYIIEPLTPTLSSFIIPEKLVLLLQIRS